MVTAEAAKEEGVAAAERSGNSMASLETKQELGRSLDWSYQSRHGQSSFYHMLRLIGGCTGDHNGTLVLFLIGSREAHTQKGCV